MSISEKSIQLTAPQIGKAGELRVRSELVLRGFTPAVCDQDDGIDIILANNGKRLQVKTARLPQNNHNYGWKYSFAIRSNQFRQGNKGQYKKIYTRKNYTDKIDFFIFWCVQHDWFYIVPENAVGEKVSFITPIPEEYRKYKITERTSKSKYEVYKNAWHLLA